MPTPTTNTTYHPDKERKLSPTIHTTEARTEPKHFKKGPTKYCTRPQSPAPSTATSTHNYHNHNITMSTSQSAAAASEMTYYLVPNLQALDSSACEMDASTHAWVQPTIIEDDDLTFGGKSLSAWYEEDRRRLSHSDGEESRRGRERVRRSHSSKSSRK